MEFRCHRCHARFDHAVQREQHEQCCGPDQTRRDTVVDLTPRHQPFAVECCGQSFNAEPSPSLIGPSASQSDSQLQFAKWKADHWESIPDPASYLQSRQLSPTTDTSSMEYQMLLSPPTSSEGTPEGESCCAGVGNSNQQVEKKNKQQKEREAREVLSRMMQATEDLIENYLNYSSDNALSSGNANAAGHAMGKIDLHTVQLALLKHNLHEGYLAAMSTGRLPEWQAEQRQIITAQHRAPNLISNSLLEGGGDNRDCTHDRKSKRCLTHGHPDHRQCRKLRLRANFQRNLYQQIHDSNSRPTSVEQAPSPGIFQRSCCDELHFGSC